MSNFFTWLERLAISNSKVRAVLRRSLAFDPGTCIEAFPSVEPFLSKDTDEWQRQMYYLTAGLWALGSGSGERSFVDVLAQREHSEKARSDSGNLTSTERRFIALLDADRDQLPHRLRQLISLISDSPIDWSELLNDLNYWNYRGRKVQQRWARRFYGAKEEGVNESSDTDLSTLTTMQE
jgi:CRISPR system Cascade subunit CasB